MILAARGTGKPALVVSIQKHRWKLYINNSNMIDFKLKGHLTTEIDHKVTQSFNAQISYNQRVKINVPRNPLSKLQVSS